MTLLSIITPTLNSAETLAATLVSIAPLKNAGVEHIVVDSGSDDGTVEIAKQFGSEVLYHPPGNMYAAINAGMAIAKGDWLTYINGDDLLFADATHEALTAVGENVAVIYGDLDFIDEQGRFLFSRRAPSPQHLSWLIRYYNPFFQQGTLFRRQAFEKVGGFSTEFRFSADAEFFTRCSLNGERFWKFRGKSVAAFRLCARQLSQVSRKEMAVESRRVRFSVRSQATGMPDWLGVSAASIYRWSTNVDGIFLRWLRGRGQDAGFRS